MLVNVHGQNTIHNSETFGWPRPGGRPKVTFNDTIRFPGIARAAGMGQDPPAKKVTRDAPAFEVALRVRKGFGTPGTTSDGASVGLPSRVPEMTTQQLRT